MKILVTFALETEFAHWKKRHTFRAEKRGELTVHLATIGGVETGVVLTGAGPHRASAAAARVLWRESETGFVCVSAGMAGALRPQFKIAEVLAARAVISDGPRMDAALAGGVRSSEEMVTLAQQKGATVVENIYTSSSVVATAAAKKALGARADAVDMESFDIALEAAAYGIPCIVVRAVSDTCDEDLPLDMQRVFGADGQVSIPRVMGQLARHPQALPRLVRLGRNSAKAGESLATFLDSYIVELAASPVLAGAKRKPQGN